ncbi:MAG: cytochrome c1 [Gammaproteobacteria bacterium]|nr:cytochrome c1 [Gammaproteobacteria bacterium]
MKKIIAIIIIAFLPGLVMAAGGGIHLDKANIDIRDQVSLQNGARTYFQYCSGCHSIQFMRYNRMGEDLGLSDAEIKSTMMFTTDKIGELIKVSMQKKDSERWFGTAPPDLSVISRSRGVDWLYSYLRGFYLDPSRPFGVNNTVFKDVGMPHALWELQGLMQPVYESYTDAAGNEKKKITGMEQATPGALSAEEYDDTVRNLVNFLSYVGEPVQVQREQLGVYVLIFLSILLVFVYLLKKEYWRDVH